MVVICSNCGKAGHFFRDCQEPISSMGIVAYKRSTATADPVWLLIRRRVSIGFIELLRGKYENKDAENIQSLIDQTTLTERHQLQTMKFCDLWVSLWNGVASKRYQSEYDASKAKFDILRTSGLLTDLCKKSTTAWTEPEWGFPKGRRSVSETELACALRETVEETGVDRSQLCVRMDIEPIMEEYVGSNGVRYRYKYWVAEAAPTLDVQIDTKNAEQMREISDVRWCTVEEAVSLIRPYSVEKIQVLQMANAMVVGGSCS